MKTRLTYTAILFFCIAGIAIVVFSHKAPSVTNVIVLRDITDKDILQPSARDVLVLYNLTGENKWNGAIFRFSNLTDVSLNASSEFELQAENQWLSNELTRAKEIKQFQSEVSGNISDAANDPVGKSHSSLYLPMVNALIDLSRSPAQKRILLIYSDLMENDPGLSFYNEKTFSLLQSNPKSINAVLSNWESVPNLSGITIYFLFQPVDVVQDTQYRTVSQFYKNLLEEKGATVFIESNLST
jgi:hypothetical protein